MKFISKLQSLKVVIQTPRRLTDPYSGNPSSTVPGLFAQFRNGHYETENPMHIRILVEKVYENKMRGFVQTFWVHPEDEAKAQKVYANLKDSGTMAAEGIVQDKDEVIKALMAENDRIKTENRRLSGRKVGKTSAQAVMLPHDKIEEDQTQTPDITTDDVEEGS